VTIGEARPPETLIVLAFAKQLGQVWADVPSFALQ
jgi:hypothetical protein